jgi:hypothetical protein
MTHIRRTPGTKSRDTSTTATVATPNYTEAFGRDRVEPLTAEDGADAAVLAAAAERGYRLATRCLDCRRWLVAERSVQRHLGPVCAAKMAVAA